MYETADAVIKAWVNAVNLGDSGGILALYRDDAILLPTFANRTLRTHEAIGGYFNSLAARPGLEVSLHARTVSEQALTNDVRCVSGICLWRFEVDGEAMNFEARFTFIIDLARDAPIVHHHSSQLPRML